MHQLLLLLLLSVMCLALTIVLPAHGQPEPEWQHHTQPCPKGTPLGRPCQPSRHSLKFGCILPLSGEKGQAGLAEQFAIQLSLTDSRFAGKAQLVCINTQCDPAKSAAAMKSLAGQGVLAVVGDICSGASAAAAVVATAARIPLISAASGASSLSQVDYFYRTVPSDAYQGLAASRLVASRGSKKVGLLREATVYGSGLAADFTSNFVGSRGGGEVPVVFNVSAQPPPAAAEAAVAAFKAAAAAGQIDAVFISSNNNSLVAALLQQAASQQLGLPLFGGGGVADPALFKLVEGTASALGQLEASTVSPGSQAFIDRFRAVSQNKNGYHPGVARAYDAMGALLRAYYRTSRPWVGQELRPKLQQVKFEGVSGPVAFDVWGDLVPSNRSYVAVTFNMVKQQLEYGDPISLD